MAKNYSAVQPPSLSNDVPVIIAEASIASSKISNLLLRKANVVNIALGELRKAIRDFRLRETEILTVPLVESYRQPTQQHRHVLDISENAFNNFPITGIAVGFEFCGLTALYILYIVPFSFSR